MAPASARIHYTAGGTWTFHNGYELSGYAGLSPRNQISGHNSIPAALGGGEANVSNELYMLGFSLGRRFGG